LVPEKIFKTDVDNVKANNFSLKNLAIVEGSFIMEKIRDYIREKI
jgi:hypothetical protein